MADLTITHTHAEGTLLHGDPRPDHRILKDAGWRWSRNLEAWYVPRSRDRDGDPRAIERVAGQLEAAGHDVTWDVHNERRSAADREADRQQRAADRAAGLDRKAGRQAAEATARFDTADRMASAIPFGQPVLVGHHSEGRDLRYRQRIVDNMDRGVEAHRAAQESERRAATAERNAEALDVRQTTRKLADLEAEDRLIGRRLDGDEGARVEYHGPAASGAYRERLLRRSEQLADDLAYWRGHLEQLQADGAKLWTRDDIAPGDSVNGDLVVRVNAKTVTVRPRYGGGPRAGEFLYPHAPRITSKVPYGDIRTVEKAAGA